MSKITDMGTELPDKTDVKTLLNDLSFGYEFQMSDYAVSQEQELEYMRVGMAQIDKVAEKIARMIDDAYESGYDEGYEWANSI